MSSRRLARDELRAYIREKTGIETTKRAFEAMASRGEGPRYSIFLGRASYSTDDIDAWIADNMTPGSDPVKSAAGKRGALTRVRRRAANLSPPFEPNDPPIT